MQDTSSIAHSRLRSIPSSILCLNPLAKQRIKRSTAQGSMRDWANQGAKSKKSLIPTKLKFTVEPIPVSTVSTFHLVIPVRNVSGHSMVKGSIHGSKGIPLIFEETAEKMEEGEIFAIETFATTGRGVAKEAGMTSHYALNALDEYPALQSRGGADSRVEPIAKRNSSLT